MNTNFSIGKSAAASLAFSMKIALAAAAVAGASVHAAGIEPGAAAHAPAVVAQNGPCRNCGVVESVKRVQRPGSAKGIAGTPVTPGMAIGGVVGGLVGNQFGHGSGRSAMTLAGAAGGAYAGHAIEKNQAQRTAYVMHIRMADGSHRTIEQSTPLRKGSHVVVEGKRARVAQARDRAHG